MRADSLVKYLKMIREQYGADLFTMPDRLCSVLTDLAGAERLQREMVLLKTCFRYAEAEMTAYVRALAGKGSVEAALYDAKQALPFSFVPPDEAEELLKCLAAAFGMDLQGVDDGTDIQLLLIHTEQLSDALIALDDQYQNKLWQKGDVLASLLADQAPELAVERQLITRIYAENGAAVRKLITVIVGQKDETGVVSDLRAKLLDSCVDAYYADAFLTAVLDIFGLSYAYAPREQKAGTQDTDQALSGQGASQNKGDSESGQGTQNVHRTGANAGAGQGGKTAAVPKKKKHGFRRFVLLILLAFALWKGFPRIQSTLAESRFTQVLPVWLTGGSAEDEISEEIQEEELTAQADDAVQSEDAETEDTQQKAEEEETLYIPQVELTITLESVDATVYDESLTDLRNYAKYQGRGFQMAYPTTLYSNVELSDDLFNTMYEFTGTDGSYLEYIRSSLQHKYTAAEYRETVVATLTSGMTDVQYLTMDDGDSEAYFTLSATEGDLYVFIAGEWSYSTATTMILKYPEPLDEDDR
ncbi:MAG: hypothetical protein LUG56_01220, partial [Lachnospiraceae bacterium]|nr:hypothetical protein [Lachnospiraceae bacterium]